MKKVELRIIGLSYSQTQVGSYVLVLGKKKGNTRLPIIIKPLDAQYISMKIEDIKTGFFHEIYDGVMYALNNHDEHNLYGGSEDMRLICVFNPPIKGTENHDENGVYPLVD